jgi:hypothetical protein
MEAKSWKRSIDKAAKYLSDARASFVKDCEEIRSQSEQEKSRFLAREAELEASKLELEKKLQEYSFRLNQCCLYSSGLKSNARS